MMSGRCWSAWRGAAERHGAQQGAAGGPGVAAGSGELKLLHPRRPTGGWRICSCRTSALLSCKQPIAYPLPVCANTLRQPACLACLACHPCRNVNALAARWEDLRQGHTTFAAVSRTASGGVAGARAGAGAGALAAQPQRRRLVRAGAVGSGGGRLTLDSAAGSRDVIDLLDSPSPAGRWPSAAATTEEELAWQAMEAAMAAEGAGQQQQPQRRRSGSDRWESTWLLFTPPQSGCPALCHAHAFVCYGLRGMWFGSECVFLLLLVWL